MASNEDNKNIDKSLIEMQSALLGIASQEEDVLGNLKAQLETLLNNTYRETRELQKVVALDAMVTETPLTQVDPSLIEGIDHVSKELNAKNDEIKKLQRLLALLGVDASGVSAQSIDTLRQTLDELNKRNRILRSIQSKLAQHPMISGQIPKGVPVNEINKMLIVLNNEIKKLNKTNFDLKQKIKMDKLKGLQKEEPKLDETPSQRPRGIK